MRNRRRDAADRVCQFHLGSLAKFNFGRQQFSACLTPGLADGAEMSLRTLQNNGITKQHSVLDCKTSACWTPHVLNTCSRKSFAELSLTQCTSCFILCMPAPDWSREITPVVSSWFKSLTCFIHLLFSLILCGFAVFIGFFPLHSLKCYRPVIKWI